MIQPGRKYSVDNYRYGFNGKENDNEVKGEGNQQDYGMRIYDPRLGKFLSRDPLYKDYPELTPYQFASNTPIRAVDLDGGEMKDVLDFGWGPEYSRREDIRQRLAKKDGHEWILIPAAVVTGAGVGSLMSVPAAVTSTVTFLGRAYILYEVVSAFQHNKAPTPEGRLMQENERKEHLSNAFMAFGADRIIGLLTKITLSTGRIVYKTFQSSSIRFSQSSISGLDEIVTSMKKNGWRGDPIDIVKMEDNIYTTVDNTRLMAAQKAGIDVKATAHNFDDLIPEEMAKRFMGKDVSLPKTWGEAVKNRVQNQNKQFRTSNENGSFVQPKADNSATGTGG